MKIDRDNFRHLTGFGRDMTNYIGSVLEKLHDGVFVVGGVNTVHVYHDQDKERLGHRLFWTEGETYQSAADIAIKAQVCIIVDRGGCREITSVPLFMVLNIQQFYHVYNHVFLSDQNGENVENATYIGVTKRGWRTRWSEHLRAAETGSHCRFHKAIRQYANAKCVFHGIMGHASSEQMAMEIEERLVEHNSLYPLGLNMIPGGYAGLAYLRKIGAVGAKERVGVDDKDAIINRFFERTSRKGLPNPLAAANWLNSDYAEKVICAGEDRLKPQQIRDARFFSSLGQDVDTIASRVGARNSAQVQRLLSGQTYSRIA